MNRLLKSLALSLVAAIFSCLSAHAQSCGNWEKVTAWTGTYTINGKGSGVDPQKAYNWTLEHQGSGAANLNQGPTACSATLDWKGKDSSDTGSVMDVGTVVPDPCQNQSQDVQLIYSATSPAGSNGHLEINLSTGMYTFSDQIELGGTQTTVDCAFSSPSSVQVEETPCNFTFPSFPLPGSPQPLSQTNSPLNGDANCPLYVLIPWTFTFTLNPVFANDNQDHPCNKKKNSTIACQNQSLGEDVPIVGTGFFLHYESERAAGTSGANSTATTDTLSLAGWTLNVHHVYDLGTNTLFLGDGTQRSAWQFGAPVTLNGNTLLTSEDGSEVYVFDSTGRHLQTLRPLTGALKYQFAYDAAGNLSTITDGSGNVTTITRDSSEHPTAIVSPFGQTSNLSLDSNGFLSQVTDPAGNTVKFTNTSMGLMTARTDSNGNVYNYSYDSTGKLTLDSDPAGGSTTLARTDSATGYSVTATTALGRTDTYQVTTGGSGEQFTNTWADGLQATMTNTQQNGQLSESRTLPDGTASSGTLGPDPRFGLQVPVPLSQTLKLGNLTMTATGSRTATLGTTGNPFSLTTQTDTASVNSRTYTSVFTASTKTFVGTTPMKRKTTTILDSLERLSSIQQGTLLPVKFAYDANGRLSTITQGTRVTTLAYDSKNFLASSTNPLKQTASFTHDAAGHLLSTTLPDGRIINYTYDANGNRTSVTPPGKSAHDSSYTSVNLLSAYTPPAVSGTGATSYAYDADRDLTTITRPDGKTILFGYDSAGRLSSATTPTETVNYSYDATTGNLSSASIAGGEALAYGYNGPLATSSALTGTVAGTVSRTYNNNFWIASESINGGNTVNYTYDKDGLMTKAGALVVKQNSNGLISGTTLGSITDTFSYSTFGEPSGYTADYKTGTTVTPVYVTKYTRDADGRISAKTETIGTSKTTFTYTFDKAGRLTSVKQNGTTTSTYAYDTNSNRLSATTASGTVTATYDAQDRLLTYGNALYTYTANGELASQTAGTQTTTYTYDAVGNLTAVTLPNGNSITYIVDARNRRVGKEVNGVLAAGFLYDGYRIVAQLNGSNAITSQFVYATRGTSPDFMIQGGVTYRFISDQLGSPRMVVNTTTGAIAEQISYDEFGNVLNDTNPGFQPFGFAGGLYDQDTKLVRFGARDYNPSIGRWTAKDPIIFAGGNSNLYGYVLNDPVNMIDPLGLRDPDFYTLNVSLGGVGGVQFTLTIDAYGNFYLGAGAEVGLSLPISGSLTAHWLNTCRKPTASELNAFLTGLSLSGGGGYFVGGQETWTPGSGLATGVGVSTPQVGIGATDSIAVGAPGGLGPQPPIEPWEPQVPIGDGLVWVGTPFDF